MAGPLVRDAALHGVVPAALTVGLVYAATATTGTSFGPLGLGMLLVGLFLGRSRSRERAPGRGLWSAVRGAPRGR